MSASAPAEIGSVLVFICVLLSWQICCRKLFAKPGKNVLPLSVKGTCRLVGAGSPSDNSVWGGLKKKKIQHSPDLDYVNGIFKLNF